MLQILPQRRAAKKATAQLTDTLRTRSNSKRSPQTEDIEDIDSGRATSRPSGRARATSTGDITTPRILPKITRTYGKKGTLNRTRRPKNYPSAAGSSRTASSSPPRSLSPEAAVRSPPKTPGTKRPKRAASSDSDVVLEDTPSPIKRRKTASRQGETSSALVVDPPSSFPSRPAMSTASSSGLLSDQLGLVHLEANSVKSSNSIEGLVWAQVSLDGDVIDVPHTGGIWWPGEVSSLFIIALKILISLPVR